MTENSYYFPGTTIGDAGPYGAATTYKVFAQLARAGNAESLAALYDMGVFYAVANQLEPTINGANIDVDTGASLIDGAYHENDATVSVPITASGVGVERIDLIVVRKNYQTAVTYTPAGGAPTVPPQTSRITVIRGAEAGTPVAPSVTQDTTRTTYWDIPLATVQVNNAGALSNLTDLREYVDAETKQMWVMPGGGRDESVAADLVSGGGTSGDNHFLMLTDGNTCRGMGTFIVPQDFISGMTVTAVVVALANGDVAVLQQETKVRYSQCDEAYATHTDCVAACAVGVSTYTLTSGQRECIAEITMASPTVGDMAILEFNRQGGNAADTVNAVVGLHGWIVEYFGWKK